MTDVHAALTPMLIAYNNPITTAERNALSVQPATVIYNSDDSQIQIWNGSAWEGIPLAPPGSDTLQQVLTAGNDGGGLDMINLNNVTLNQLNYTTLNPPVASGATEVGQLTDCMTVTTDAQFVDSISLGNPHVGSAGGGLSSSSNTIAISSTALSTEAALINLTNGVNNISIGNESGQGLSTGDNNVFMGYQAAKNAPTNCRNSVFIGSGCYEGGGSTTLAEHCVGIGYNAMHGTSSTGVTDNTAIGAYSMFQIIDGDYNTAVGKSSMLQLRTGYRNTGVGWEAGIGNQSGNDNVSLGYRAYDGAVVGNRNTALGTEALGGSYGSNTADNNIGIGYLAGKSMTSGSRNVIIGGALQPIAGTTTDDQLRLCNGDGTVDWLEGVQTGEVYVGGSTAPTKVHCSTINVDDNTSAIGGASASISGATLTVDGGSSSYAYARVTVPATSTITTLTATNVRENGQLVILIEGSASGTLTIQGSDAGGITNAKVNFTSNVDVANNENALLTMFKGNGNIFISASKYL